MAKFFRYPFATAGDKTAVPDATQPSGSVSYQSGWTSDYQKILGTDPDAKPIPRDQSNQLMFDVTDNIRQYQTLGVPEFITTADNGGTPFPYDIYARVRYDDGVNGYQIYESLKTNNTSLPDVVADWNVISGVADSVPTGALIAFGGTSAPDGFLPCNGTMNTVSRTTYAALFATIGTTWGAGDGSTTFGIPNMSRCVPMGSGGAGSGIIGNAVGNGGGGETTTLDGTNMPAVTYNTRIDTNQNGSGGDISTIGAGPGTTGSMTFTPASPPVGFNIIQPARIVLWCIKY